MKSFNIKASLSFSIIIILLTGSVSLFAGADLLDNKISLDATDGKVSNIPPKPERLKTETKPNQ